MANRSSAGGVLHVEEVGKALRMTEHDLAHPFLQLRADTGAKDVGVVIGGRLPQHSERIALHTAWASARTLATKAARQDKTRQDKTRQDKAMTRHLLLECTELASTS